MSCKSIKKRQVKRKVGRMGYKKGKKKYFYDPKSGRCISMHMQKYTLVTPNLIFYNEHVLLKV
jgi:hypothetical protein